MSLYAFIPAVLGLIGLATFPNIDENSALATVSTELLPPAIAGILLSGVISATLSSASGNLLAVASVYIKDVHSSIFKKELKDEAELTASRWIVIITGIGAIGISLFSQQIIPLLVFAFTIRSTGPFAAYLLGLLVDKVTKNAGLLSIIIGTAVGIIWEYLENPYGIMAVIVGSVASLLTFLIVNKIELKRGVPIAPSPYVDK